MKLNLAQELASVDQKPLFLVFLDLRKAYDNQYCGRLLKTLERYGAEPKMWGILAEFWARQEVVTRKNGDHGPQFRATCGTTQGGLTFTTLFNVAVDNVVRNWLSITVEDDMIINYGMVHVVIWSMGVFYAENGLIGPLYPEWILRTLNVLIGLFYKLA